MKHTRPLSPAMESLFQRIEQALNSAEGMAILVGEQYGPSRNLPRRWATTPGRSPTRWSC